LQVSPYINRFLQPDTIIPGLANPQSWNRYSYVTNRPINFNDPTGHMRLRDGPTQDRFKLSLYRKYKPKPAKIIKHDNGDGGRDNGDTDTNGNGVPDAPDPNVVIPESGGTCQYGDLTECLYSGGAWPSGDFIISDEEWNQLTLALFYDVYSRSHKGDGFWTLVYDPTGRSKQENTLFVPFHTEGYYHREVYDTPFWNHYGAYSGNVCFESGTCYDRNDVNYVAQGMWSAAALEGPIGAIVVANVWKLTQYDPPHLASADVNYWAARGVAIYDNYINLGLEP
jgi:hypothetical protein